MTKATGYGFAAAAQILDVPETRLRYWAQIGFVGPSTRAAGKLVYTFRDLVNVKAARELVDRGFSTAQIRKALDQIRSSVPAAQDALGQLRVGWDGQGLVLSDDAGSFDPSGQRTFDFGLQDLAARAAVQGGAVPLERSAALPARSVGPKTALDCLNEGLVASAVDGQDAAAEACFRLAIELDSGLAAAHTNLAYLAARRGDRAAARASLEIALGLDPDQPEARYDLATLALRDGESELAAAELRRVLQLRPDFGDAHYNLSTALEQLGGRQQAREHLLRFLELGAVAEGEAATALSPWIDEARSRLARM